MSIVQEIDLALAEAVAEVNEQLPGEHQLDTDEGTVLAGEGGVLDSLGLLSFLVAIEQRFEARCGVQAGLVGADFDEDGPLSNLGTLKNHLVSLASES